MPEFPVVPVLFTMEEGSQNPYTDAGKVTTLPWDTTPGKTGVKGWSSNAGYPTTTGFYYNPEQYFSPAVSAKMTVLPSGQGRFFRLWACLDIVNWTGYYAVWEEELTAGQFRVSLLKWTAPKAKFPETLPGETFKTKVVLAEGDSVGIFVNEAEGKVYLYIKHGAGAWEVLISAVDSTYNSGYIGLEAGGSSGRILNFAGGQTSNLGVAATCRIAATFGVSAELAISSRRAQTLIEAGFGVEASLAVRQPNLLAGTIQSIFSVRAPLRVNKTMMGNESTALTNEVFANAEKAYTAKFPANFSGYPETFYIRTNGVANTGVTKVLVGIFHEESGEGNQPSYLLWIGEYVGTPPINTWISCPVNTKGPLLSGGVEVGEALSFIESVHNFWLAVVAIGGKLHFSTSVATGGTTVRQAKKTVTKWESSGVGGEISYEWEAVKAIGPVPFYVVGLETNHPKAEATLASSFLMAPKAATPKQARITIASTFALTAKGGAMHIPQAEARLSATFGVKAKATGPATVEAEGASRFILLPQYEGVTGSFAYGDPKKTYVISNNLVGGESSEPPLESDTTLLSDVTLLSSAGSPGIGGNEIVGVTDESIKQGLRDLGIFEEIKE